MKKIVVIELLKSPILLSEEKGKELLKALKKSFDKLGDCQIDFQGYKFLSSAFLNSSFGQLCIDENISIGDFNKKFEVINLDDNGKDDLELCLSNAQLRKKFIDKGCNEEDFYSTIAYS